MIKRVQIPTCIALAQVRLNKQGLHTMKYKSCTIMLLSRSAAQALGHAWRAVIFRPGYKHFLTSNFADGKNIQFTIRILSRPTWWITMTETVVKAQRSRRVGDRNDGIRKWKSPGSNHASSFQHVYSTSTKPPTIATQLSLALQQILCVHSR